MQPPPDGFSAGAPSNLNYALGLTSLRFWPYLGVSILGSIPNLALYVFGTAGIVALVQEGSARPGSLGLALLFLVFVALMLRGLQAIFRRKAGG